MRDIIGKQLLFAFLFIATGRCAANINTCQPPSAGEIQDVFGPLNYAQEGLWHRVSCLGYRPGEEIDRVIWWNESSLEGAPKIRMISYFQGQGHPTSNRSAFSSNFSFVIKGVEKSDEGNYSCEVNPHAAFKRFANIYIRVIGDLFPSAMSDVSNSTSLKRAHRQTLPCPCAPQSPDASISVVYWSTGKGITSETEIIGARFSDGTVLQIRHGADYSIAGDASLTVNSLNDVQYTQRFWCHVFYQDSTLCNGYVDVLISDEQQLTDGALKASETFVYILKDTRQVLPCTSWAPGDTSCEIKWSKVNNSDPHIVLKYNLSTDVILADPSYDLDNDFSLVIQSANDDHAGKYRCVVENETNEKDLEVRVIGEQFQLPVNDGRAIAGENVIVESEMPAKLTLICPAGLYNSVMSTATVIWSYGAPDAQTTTVIGMLNLLDDSKTMSDLGDNGCFAISSKGSLIMNSCTQDDDVRYWCHVFPLGDLLKASYVDVLIKAKDAAQPYEAFIVPIAIACVAIVILVSAALLWCYYKHVRTESGDSPTTPLNHRSPGSFELDNFYTPPELLLNARVKYNGIVKYKLESDSEIFDDGISELISRHVLIEGRSGSGKTTFLRKLEYDWKAKKCSSGLYRFVKRIKASDLVEATAELSEISSNCLSLILIDDCNERNDIVHVMKVISNLNHDCHVAMTTRHAQLAEDMSRECDLRHITITGFTADNARNYVQKVSQTGKEDIRRYLDECILFPRVAGLPAFLYIICHLPSLDAHKRRATVGGLLFTVLERMFRRPSTSSSMYDASGHEGTFKGPLQQFFEVFGQDALTGIIERGECKIWFSKTDFLQYCDEECLESGIKFGLLCSKYESKTKSIDGDECLKLPLLTRNSKVKFVTEIFQQFCAGKYMAQNVGKWIKVIDLERHFERLANVLVFASADNPKARLIIVDFLIKMISQKRTPRERSLKYELRLRQIIESVLELNFEGRCAGELNEQLSTLFCGGQIRLIGISSYTIRLVAYCLKYALKTKHSLSLKSIELIRIGKLDWADFKEHFECFGGASPEPLDSDVASGVNQIKQLQHGAVKQLRERLESRNKDMPVFPPDQPDMSVIKTVTSFGLQELTESQSNKCHSSVAEIELARYLPDQQHLQSLTLIGTIFDSQEIRDFVHNLNNLTSLKKLDLRLNTETDDRAFVKLTTSLRGCESLSDLRLSLFKVTKEGFAQVQKEMEGDASSFDRLQTLYLLHGSLAESYDKFLADSLQYTVNVSCLHVSALPGLPDDIENEFKQNIPKPEILKELVIDSKMVDTSDWLKRDPKLEASTSYDAQCNSDTAVSMVDETTL